jgi:hypothetical protein
MSARSIQRRRKALLAGGTALGATALFAPAAEAGTFTVTELDDSGPGTLRQAVDDANGNPGADVITFEAGLSGDIVLASEIPIEEALEIQGPGADVIRVDGDASDRIFYINTDNAGDPREPVTISGLTLRNGDESIGGAIRARLTDLTVAGSVLEDNYASARAGAVYVVDGPFTLVDSVVSENEANDGGGGVYTDGSVASEPGDDVVIQRSVFIGNESLTDDGGGAYFDYSGGDVLVEDSTFAGNEADIGGAIQQWGQPESTTFVVRDSTISGNTATDQGGGINFGYSYAPARIENSTISGNDAAEEGGGLFLYNDHDVDVTVANSTVAGNSADEGGGIYRLANDDEGGDDSVILSSSIVANNSADDGPDLFDEPADPVGSFVTGFSLVESTAGDATITESPAGSNIFGQDPGLAGLAANGGPTQTHLPLASSPVIDAGVANGLGTDQRGQPRTFDAAVVDNAAGSDGTDIGSVELQPGEGGLLGNAECKGVTVPKIVGTSGDDTLRGTNERELITGRGGDDAIRARGGKDCANGNSGNDNVHGGPESDQVKGGGGKDRAKGGGDGDRVKGQAGKDRVGGGGGDDKVTGGAGKDRVKGGGGVDKIKGQGGKDRLKAVDGKSDRVNCGGGKDRATVDKNDRVSDNCEKVVERD